MVRSRYLAHHPCTVGTLFSGDGLCSSVAPGAAFARSSIRLVHQSSSDLFGYTGFRSSTSLAGNTFLSVVCKTRYGRNSQGIIRASYSNARLCRLIWIKSSLEVMWGIYARQSTLGQLLNHTESTEMQTEDLAAWLVDKGVKDGQWKLFDADLGVSGTLPIEQRTGLQELVEYIKSGLIKAVLVYQISRL